MASQYLSRRFPINNNFKSMSRFTEARILESELAVVKAQNERLNEENVLLRDKLNRLTTNQRSTAATNVEAKIRAFQLEDERDQAYQNLEKLKKKYEKLHKAYCEKVKRCKILENTFQRQKTLTGLVMKSAIKQRNEEQSANLKARESSVDFESKLAKLQKALEEAYDIIDELEFELETIDLLEVENQRLHNDLNTLRKQFEELKAAKPSFPQEAPPSYNEIDYATGASNSCFHRTTDSICETCTNDVEFDSSSVDRAVLTNSFLKNAEMESNALRRQLLKCRLQNTKECKSDVE